MTGGSAVSIRQERATGLTTILLYGLIVLVWGSTWIGIKLQLGTVDPAVSVANRFLLAAVLVFAWALARRLPMRFPRAAHGRFALVGVLQYSVNYVLFYYASVHLVSGLVSIIFAISALFNIINSYLFLKRASPPVVIGAALLGLVGLLLVFGDQLTGGHGATLGGVLLGLGGTASFSLGNIASAKTQQAGVPVVQATAWSMLYGGLFTTVGCLLTGHRLTVEVSASYLLGLAYLAVFGSAIAFVTYLTLLRRIGPERVGYATVVFPVVALTLSTVFEGYHWTLEPLLGVALVVAANAVILVEPLRKQRARARGGEHTDTAGEPAEG